MEINEKELKSAVDLKSVIGLKSVVPDTPENLNICKQYCGTCPSLPFSPNPYLFCARGCSSANVEKKGCNCTGCPIYKKYRLGSLYFCETGKAEERRE
ncbi:DUF2769 domain-containing protein [Methanosarcina sp. Mfa9]|uniref:DUF2769 domain-containing protein n=1 Tax=Methanosarcina sp. Mfa9 TaxID=3439063 RepID=UPI003F87EB57